MPSVYSKVEQYHEYASFYSETFNRHIQKAYFTELSSTICSLYIFYRHFFCIFLTFSAWWSFRSIGALVVFKKRSESFIRHLLSTRVDSVLYGRVVVFSGPLRARTVSPIWIYKYGFRWGIRTTPQSLPMATNRESSAIFHNPHQHTAISGAIWWVVASCRRRSMTRQRQKKKPGEIYSAFGRKYTGTRVLR